MKKSGGSMKNYLLILLLTISASFAWAQVDDEELQRQNKNRKFITITLGVEYDEKLPPMPDNISFKGDFRKVTSASYSKEINVLRFSAQREGIANLTIHDAKGKVISEYTVTVKKSKLDKVLKEIQSLLGDVEGINFKIINEKVVVDGQILLPRDMNRIYSVIRQYGDQAASLVTLSPLAQKKIAEFISRDINNPEIEVRAVNDKFILQGYASDQGEVERAMIIAKTYVPDIIVEAAEADGVIKKRKVDVVINLLDVKAAAAPPPSKMIQLVVHYVEMQKDYSKGFRFQFTPTLSDNSGVSFSSGNREPGSVMSSITGTINNLLPKLNWAKQHGHARILQSTSLIVQDKKKGDVKSTQNIPYQVVSKEGQPSTSFAEVGLRTSIIPSIVGEKSDSITLELDFGMSDLIGMTDAGPLTSQSSLQTMITVRSGQSAAVGGLIANRAVTGYNKLPKNADANPIISLYASKDFQRQQSQFVVFITPIIKSSASAGTEKIKQKFKLRD